MKPMIVMTCLIGATLAVPAQAAEGNVRMFKCVDAAGKAYYSDKMNPDCGQSSELNRQGVVMPKKDVAKSARSAKGDAAGSAPINSQSQDRRDRALMATYTSEDEIDAARDRSLSIPAQGTKSVEAKLNKANQSLTELKKRADALAEQKKPLPALLLEDVSASQKEIATLEADFAQRKAQSDAIRVKYEADKQRYRELRGSDQAAR